ncbi:hypothetical protein BU24DRAFT_426396 [Aaosphaeria arxii CBS 175.79]|uniref:DUF7730 domain-containing protein n=1 Tax=Aaosphaeria arxii CBS 175.79 TaxID=1450172 RepID=A0A6A5XEP2_9PLEO|nr:uncharacterized protein BU24DRAFT_426396 [Aaosphaeria arxii CBS 175.79]KAF2011311.1 hypothetical protein BU24DRAFT_426396 [Aaosphaeria arxii CBS 175.79]
MSLSQSAIQDTSSTGRYSKRKRVQVNYYVDGSDIEDNEKEDEEDLVAYKPSKKRRVARPLPKHKIFPFLELPAEIRNMIYEYALVDPKGVHLYPNTQSYRRSVVRAAPSFIDRYWGGSQTRFTLNSQTSETLPLRPLRLVPSLLAANSQIYHEAKSILYGNHFQLYDPLALHSFMVDIGPRAAAMVKNITLASWGWRRGMHKAYNHACFTAMTSAVNIEKFTFGGLLYCHNDPKWVARQIYRDAFPFLEAVGAAKGKVDAAIDIFDISEQNFDTRHRWRRTPQVTRPYEESISIFKTELSRLLGMRMDKVRSKPVKRRKAEDYEL